MLGILFRGICVRRRLVQTFLLHPVVPCPCRLLSRAETAAEVGGAGFAASATALLSLFNETAAQTLGMSSLSSLLHAIVLGLYAVVFAGLAYLLLRDRLRPTNPLLRLWLNTFAFCVVLVVLDTQLRVFSSEITRALQSWPTTTEFFSFLRTPLGAQVYFLIPVGAAAVVSILVFAKEVRNSRYPALRRVAEVFS